MFLKNHTFSLDVPDYKKIFLATMVCIFLYTFWLLQSSDEIIPIENQLIKHANVSAIITLGRNAHVQFKKTKNLLNEKDMEWNVPVSDFNTEFPIIKMINFYEKKNQSQPIVVWSFENNKVKKIWRVKFGDDEIMTYERAKQMFEIDVKTSRQFFYIFIALLGLLLLSLIRIQRIAIVGDKK
jgi:hypothetical protein